MVLGQVGMDPNACRSGCGWIQTAQGRMGMRLKSCPHTDLLVVSIKFWNLVLRNCKVLKACAGFHNFWMPMQKFWGAAHIFSIIGNPLAQALGRCVIRHPGHSECCDIECCSTWISTASVLPGSRRKPRRFSPSPADILLSHRQPISRFYS